jgi:hypothetical protein
VGTFLANWAIVSLWRRTVQLFSRSFITILTSEDRFLPFSSPHTAANSHTLHRRQALSPRTTRRLCKLHCSSLFDVWYLSSSTWATERTLWGFRFWVVTLCSVVVGYQRFRGPCCHHLQGAVTTRGGSMDLPQHHTASQPRTWLDERSDRSKKRLWHVICLWRTWRYCSYCARWFWNRPWRHDCFKVSSL